MIKPGRKNCFIFPVPSPWLRCVALHYDMLHCVALCCVANKMTYLVRTVMKVTSYTVWSVHLQLWMSLFDECILSACQQLFWPTERELKFFQQIKTWLILRMCKPENPAYLVNKPSRLILSYNPECYRSCCFVLQCTR